MTSQHLETDIHGGGAAAGTQTSPVEMTRTGADGVRSDPGGGRVYVYALRVVMSWLMQPVSKYKIFQNVFSS